MNHRGPMQGDALKLALVRAEQGVTREGIAAELRDLTGNPRITGPMVNGALQRERARRAPASRPHPSEGAERKEEGVPGGLGPQEIGQQIGQISAPTEGKRSANDPLPAPSVSKGLAGFEDKPPAVHTSRSRADNHLIISDLQIPYHHPGALEFCRRVRQDYNIPLENVLCAGDEFDFYWMSRFEKSPDAEHTASQEIEAGREEIACWKAAFPYLRIAESNHVRGRLAGAASRGGLASAFIREVREVFNLPETWRWADHWIVEGSKQRWRLEHGNVGPGGHGGLRGRPLNRGVSTAWGHEHAEPGALHLNTHGGGQLWGMRVGSLLTREPVAALAYNAEQGSRPVGSVGVVLDGGRTPLVVRI